MKVLYTRFMMHRPIDDWAFHLYGENSYYFFDDPKYWDHMVYPKSYDPLLIGGW